MLVSHGTPRVRGGLFHTSLLFPALIFICMCKVYRGVERNPLLSKAGPVVGSWCLLEQGDSDPLCAFVQVCQLPTALGFELHLTGNSMVFRLRKAASEVP